jgi:hypothetical protein
VAGKIRLKLLLAAKWITTENAQRFKLQSLSAIIKYKENVLCRFVMKDSV